MTAPLLKNGSNHEQPTAIVLATSTNSEVAVPGLAFDLRHSKTAFFQGTVATHTIDINWYAAGKADFSDELLYDADASNAAGVYTKSFVDPPMAYLRAKIKSSVNDTAGTLAGSAFAK